MNLLPLNYNLAFCNLVLKLRNEPLERCHVFEYAVVNIVFSFGRQFSKRSPAGIAELGHGPVDELTVRALAGLDA